MIEKKNCIRLLFTETSSMLVAADAGRLRGTAQVETGGVFRWACQIFCPERTVKIRLLCLFCIAFEIAAARAEIRLPSVISDHAMFQADKSVTIWGWAKPGMRVKVALVTIAGSSAGFEETADSTGKWAGHLHALKSGTSGDLTITAKDGDARIVKDILVGEVWLGSGQSNMEYDVAGTGRTDLKNVKEVAEVAKNVATAKVEAQAAEPPIRYFLVTKRRSTEPADDVGGHWVLGNAENVARFSAVAWNFAVALQNKLHAPVGLIVSSVGNTPIEVWMSKETLEATSVGAAVFARSKVELAAATPEKIAKYDSDLAAWQAANPTPQQQMQNQGTKPTAPPNLSAQNFVPTQYYNTMIRGLEPYTIRGILWYQGAGNSMHPSEYSELFVALIREWRNEWNDSHLPFYFVEESNWGPKQTEPVEINPTSIIREQQHVALTLPAVDLICSVDLGNGSPHYPNKKIVGERFAGLALHDPYHKIRRHDSPLYQSFHVEANKIRLKFTNSQGLRVKGGGGLKGFAIRGADGKWVWASGKISGREIILWSDRVPAPVAARYAWALNPITSVENDAQLPLCPFRTDTQSKD